jgi:hypothetical protein
MIGLEPLSSVSIDKYGPAGDSQALDALEKQILHAVAGIRFGSVELVIHEGRVVQIERRERVRLERQGGAEAEG